MKTIKMECAGGCGSTDKLPAYEDLTEKDPAKRLKPSQAYAFICLGCWRAGWRCTGWLVYQVKTVGDRTGQV